jgi:hypothetical protein
MCCHNIFCKHKFHKIENYFFLMLKKIIWANFQIIIEIFTQKIVNKLSKIWVWDPGSGKNPFRFPDPGVKKPPDLGTRIRIRNTEKRISTVEYASLPQTMTSSCTTIRTNKMDSDPYPQPVLWNRNRRNRDFLP